MESIKLQCFTLLLILATLITSSCGTPLQMERERMSKGFAGRYNNNNDSPTISWTALPNPRYRLNNTFIPEHYDVELVIILDQDPDIGEQFTAPGKVKITTRPTEDTTRITLHANLLNIDYDSIKVTKVSDPSLKISIIGYDNDTISGSHFLFLDIDTVLEEELEYDLEINYIAPISTTKRNGLYLSVYTDPDTGEEMRQAATQMESTYCRELFPSFDEPGLKATFNVTLIRKNNYTALANGEIISSTPDPQRPGWTIDKFEKTPLMPTYLIAIFVSHFTFVEIPVPTPNGDVAVRVHGPPDMIAKNSGNYTVEATANVFREFNDYFDTPNYPFTKMDSVAVPQKGGAMENYALILYRYDLLMHFEGETTERKRYAITDVIAHEVNKLWLNEGFATYLSTLGVSLINPEFQPFEQFPYEIYQYAMIFDATNDSHPLTNNAQTHEEVDRIFSRVTYEKGGSVIHMMVNFLTESTFQKGMRYYLKEMEFKPVVQDDLFRNLQKAVDEDGTLPDGMNIKEILETWTLQRGFPLVQVAVVDSASVAISQERFGADANSESNQDPSDLWFVPISIVEQNDDQSGSRRLPDLWLAKNEISKVVQHNTSTWIMINPDATGYYRVQYENSLINLIKNQLDEDLTVISPLSRSQLLDDYFTLAFDERVSIVTALELTKYMVNEDHFTVWNTFLTQILKSYEIFTFSSTDPIFNRYFLPRVEQALEKVGVEQSLEHVGVVSMYRERLLDWACAMNSNLCMSYTDKLFMEWSANPSVNPIHVDIRPIIQCSIAASGNEGFDFILDRFREETDGTKRIDLLNSLSCGALTQSLKLNGLIVRFLNGENEMSQIEAQTIFQTLSFSLPGSNINFQFLYFRLDDVINGIYGGAVGSIGDILTNMLRRSSDPQVKDLMTAWFNDNLEKLTSIESRFDAAIRLMDDNIIWMDKFGVDILDFFNENSI